VAVGEDREVLPAGFERGRQPVPASVSVIGYVAKLDQRCSPSEMMGEPVSSKRAIESRTAASWASASSSLPISPRS